MHAVFTRLNTLLLLVLALMAAAIIAIFATRAGAGPLDPPGPPASTMHTLDDVMGQVQNVPQSWDQLLNSTNGAPGPLNPPAGCNSDRFKCVMVHAQCSATCITVYPAVLDRETGLVWQRSSNNNLVAATWPDALLACAAATTGNRGGWRLPTIAEMSSLLDGSSGTLVSPSPFTSIGLPGGFWTSTQDVNTPTKAYLYDFVNSPPQFTSGGFNNPKDSPQEYWCVRGATGDG